MTTERVLARLQGPALDELAGLLVDHVLARRVSDLVDPEWVADQVVVALEAVTTSPQAEARIRSRILDLRERVPEGRLGDRFPDEIAEPAREVMRRPFLPDRVLLGRMLSHEAFEQLLRDVLVGTLTDFTRRLRATVPKAPTKGRLGRLGKSVAGVGAFGRSMGEGMLNNLQDGVLGGLSQEIEQRAEKRIREFVEDALQAVVGQIADHMCADRHAERYGAMRAHLLDTLLATDNKVLVGEFYKLHPDDLVQTATATARALAHREGFRGEVANVVRLAIDATGDRTLEELMADAGLDAEGAGKAVDTWRAELVAQMAERGREFVATPEFAGWLGQLLGD